MSLMGQSRRFDLGLATSGLPLSTDIDATTRLARFVPIAEVTRQELERPEADSIPLTLCPACLKLAVEGCSIVAIDQICPKWRCLHRLPN